MSNYTRLLVGGSILLLFLIGFGLYLAWPLLTGAKIILATQPVDPFDPLRGQYIIIRYEISTLQGISAQEGETLYVQLQDDAEGIARFVSATTTQPSSGLFMKGIVERVAGNQVFVKYGIEQYFFEKGAQFDTRDIQVEARVDSFGQARIVQLLHDKKPLSMTLRNLSYKS